MAGLLDLITDKVKNQYQQGLLYQVINDPSSVGSEIGQLFDPKYMSQVKPMTQEQALDVALNAPMMLGTTKLNNFLYHGTSPEAAKSIRKSGFDLSKSADGTIWFTSNPNIGEVAATGKGDVIKAKLGKKLKLGGWDETDKFSTDELINMGYDGLKLKDGNEVTYQIFNPEKLKIIR